MSEAIGLEQPSWLAHKLERVEAALGVMLAGVVAGICAIVTLILIGGICYAPQDFQPLWQPIALAAGLVVVTLLAGLMLRRLGDAFESSVLHPTYHMAQPFARPNVIVRMVLGTSALAMAAAVLVAGHFWTLLFSWPNPTTAGRVVQQALTFVIMLGAAYASNGYFLCFLRALRSPDPVVNFMFRWRYLFDVMLAFAVTALADRLLGI